MCLDLPKPYRVQNGFSTFLFSVIKCILGIRAQHNLRILGMDGGVGAVVCEGKQLEGLGHWRRRFMKRKVERKGPVPKATSLTLQLF